MDHPAHLRLVFEICHHYQIHLNPEKCIFCVRISRSLGFIVSKKGIRVFPLKVEAILILPPHSTIGYLQSLQGMDNFLHRFVINYTNLTKYFMHLLKKDTPFLWDEWAQESFDAINKSLKSTPMLSPLDYGRYFLLYVVASQETIGMVLVQEDDEIHEYFIYYLSWNLIDTELWYSHVEKLALETVHAVQWLKYYILLCHTTIVALINPF